MKSATGRKRFLLVLASATHRNRIFGSKEIRDWKQCCFSWWCVLEDFFFCFVSKGRGRAGCYSLTLWWGRCDLMCYMCDMPFGGRMQMSDQPVQILYRFTPCVPRGSRLNATVSAVLLLDSFQLKPLLLAAHSIDMMEVSRYITISNCLPWSGKSDREKQK